MGRSELGLDPSEAIRRLFRAKDYAALREMAGRGLGPVAAAWSGLKPLEKAALFKLMQPEAALGFYRGLPYKEKYFLIGAFDLGAIAPILEDASPNTRALFNRFSEDMMDDMLRCLETPK